MGVCRGEICRICGSKSRGGMVKIGVGSGGVKKGTAGG
jgi:hypothetical protein